MCQNKNLKGFTLGMSVIILAATVTISLSISTVILRQLKITSVASDSQLAYQLADSLMTCFTTNEFEFGFIDSSGRNRLFPTNPTNLKNWFANVTDYNPKTLKCMDSRIFSDNMIDVNSPNPESAIFTSSSLGATVNASTTITYSDLPVYTGGAVTKFFIKRSDFPKDGCAEIEVHTAPNTSRTFISKGKVPCYGEKRIERSITKIIQ